jgi:hypothetical protein
MKLRDVLINAGIPSGYMATFFRDAELVKDVLYVKERGVGESIARLFGPQLRGVIPSLKLKVGSPLTLAKAEPPNYLNAAGKRAWRLQHAGQQKLIEEL